MRDFPVAQAALLVAILAFVFACVFALMLNAEITALENNAEIGTAMTCEQVSGVVVCVEN